MCFRHRVMDSDKMLILHILDGHRMVLVRFFRFHSRQGNAAAANHSISQRVDGIAADGTDIELAAKHIGRDIFVDDMLTIHQLDDRDAKRLC